MILAYGVPLYAITLFFFAMMLGAPSMVFLVLPAGLAVLSVAVLANSIMRVVRARYSIFPNGFRLYTGGFLRKVEVVYLHEIEDAGVSVGVLQLKTRDGMNMLWLPKESGGGRADYLEQWAVVVKDSALQQRRQLFKWWM